MKLVFERRRRMPHLRTRLVLAFLAVSIFPAILIFFVALGFMTSAAHRARHPRESWTPSSRSCSGHEVRRDRVRLRASAHRARPQLDSPDPPRDNGLNASPARAACDLRPRGRPPCRLERGREPGAAHPVGGPLLPAGEAVPARAGAHHRTLLLRAPGGAGRGHDRPAGEGPDGGRLGGGGRADREPRGAGTGAQGARRPRAAALPALPPALHARPLTYS